MKGIYLAACRARHNAYNLDYNDIDKRYNCNIIGDMLDVDLTPYDYIIATPPCNWWSKANPYYWYSEYALKTRHLLPLILIKLSKLNKPFIVENVKNIKRYKENHIFRICEKFNIKYQIIGRHIYFTNTEIDLSCKQIQDFRYGGIRVNNDGYNQGGTNVYNVIEIWLKYINRKEGKK
jgi:hypothetical protein